MTRYSPASPQSSGSWGDCCSILTTRSVSASSPTDCCLTTSPTDQSLRLSSASSPSLSCSGTTPTTRTSRHTQALHSLAPHLHDSHVQPRVVAQLLANVTRGFGRVVVSTFQSLQLFGSDCGPGSLRRSLCRVFPSEQDTGTGLVLTSLFGGFIVAFAD